MQVVPAETIRTIATKAVARGIAGALFVRMGHGTTCDQISRRAQRGSLSEGMSTLGSRATMAWPVDSMTEALRLYSVKKHGCSTKAGITFHTRLTAQKTNKLRPDMYSRHIYVLSTET